VAGEGNAGTFIPLHNAIVQEVADHGLFPAGSCQQALVQPLLKKPGLDAGDQKFLTCV